MMYKLKENLKDSLESNIVDKTKDIELNHLQTGHSFDEETKLLQKSRISNSKTKNVEKRVKKIRTKSDGAYIKDMLKAHKQKIFESDFSTTTICQNEQNKIDSSFDKKHLAKILDGTMADKKPHNKTHNRSFKKINNTENNKNILRSSNELLLIILICVLLFSIVIYCFEMKIRDRSELIEDLRTQIGNSKNEMMILMLEVKEKDTKDNIFINFLIKENDNLKQENLQLISDLRFLSSNVTQNLIKISKVI